MEAESPAGYKRHDERSLAAELARHAPVRERLGGGPDLWTIKEVGDGNLNLVFVVKGPDGGVAVKQALPYVRMVGPSWPLPLSRSHFEYMALTEYSAICPGATPKLIHRDEDLALTVMELLEPHIILRRGLMAGIRYPRFAGAISTFLARSAFLSSDLARTAAAKKPAIAAFCGNTAMCKITEDLIFTEPYFAAPMNRWTAPHLDDIVATLQRDEDLKLAASRLKGVFLTRAEALLHGDLHTGSIMVTETDTRIIDAEFAVYGPIGFDLGMLMANLLMSAFAQRGYENHAGQRASHVGWILETVEQIWHGFQNEFMGLWSAAARGDAYPSVLFEGAAAASALAAERQRYLHGVLALARGFAGLEIIRRIVGLSHVIDFEHIESPERRADREARALKLARRLLVDGAGDHAIGGLVGDAADLIDA